LSRGSLEHVSRFPELPGVYLFLDADGKALYIGKATNLRSRVRSYLVPGGDGRPQLRFLTREAATVDFVVTATVQEALLLENSLIKQRRPRYNIKLRDDKSFLMLRLDRREPWPWFRLTRKRRNDGADYYGPFASARAVRQTLRLLHKVSPLRDCTDAVFHNRSRPCMKHQIGRCPAPCTGLISRSDYEQHLDRAVAVLRGEAGDVVQELTDRMHLAAELLEFEKAQEAKQLLDALAQVVERRTAAAHERDQDAIGIHRSGDQVQVAVLSFRNGLLAGCRRERSEVDLPDDLLLADVLGRLYEGEGAVPQSVLVPVAPAESEAIEAWLSDRRGTKVELHVPQRGTPRTRLELAMQNAALADAAATDAASRRRVGAERLATLLGLDEAPARIHCIDVSTTQGVATVASRVGFADGKPNKAEYRRFRISAGNGTDDFKAMEEAVARSLGLAMEREDEELPDLLVVDGGAAQLASALRAVAELGLTEELAVCGLAKSRLRGLGDARRATDERVFLPGREEPLPLPANSPEMLLMAAVRDEAHRFAVSYHRQQRGRIGSEIDAVPGVGPTRRRQLLRHFGSLGGLRRATREELGAVPGLPASVADAVFEALRTEGPARDDA
jgi:excinuclease ABC subunit C